MPFSRALIRAKVPCTIGCNLSCGVLNVIKSEGAIVDQGGGDTLVRDARHKGSCGTTRVHIP